MKAFLTRSLPWRAMTLVGFFGLLILQPLWELVFEPNRIFSSWFILLVMVGPLLFPMAGLIKGKPYTHAWTSFIALFYFLHGVGEAFALSDTAWLGKLEVTFSAMLFTGTIFYARYRSRELRNQQG